VPILQPLSQVEYVEVARMTIANSR